MTITFKEGRSWQYENVPNTVYLALQHATSPGSYFYRQIKGRYTESEV